MSSSKGAWKNTETKVAIDEDEKDVLWLRASPVNLVVSISNEKIWIWTCKKGCEEGHNVFNLCLVKEGDNPVTKRWKIKNFECEEVEKYAKIEE